jgi:hypothetical protein
MCVVITFIAHLSKAYSKRILTIIELRHIIILIQVI